MAITYYENQKTFKLDTPNTSYIMGVQDRFGYLLHYYYGKRLNQADVSHHVKLTAVTQSKPFAFHECGTNPTEEELKTTPWAWFMTWHTNFVTEENTIEALKALYNSDYVITRDELPSFTG